MITKRIQKRIQFAKDTNAPYGVGSFSQGVILIIGEQASNPVTAPDQLPFCDHVGCSGWLNQRFKATEIQEERLFWVNILNNDGSVIDIKALVDQLKPDKIAALGNVAFEHCKNTHLDVYHFYHPQYWKRFKTREPYQLISWLKEATW